MDTKLQQEFQEKWKKYFNHAELPITLYYADDAGDIPLAKEKTGWRCIIGDLAAVRKGESLAFNKNNVKCNGGKRYMGFSNKLRPGFEYFLSCGNEEIEGERYVRTPEMVKEFLKEQVHLGMEEKVAVFRRWDKLEPGDHPEVVIFFATPDVLAGLFTLANYDQAGGDAVITRFSSGCGSIIHHPWIQREKENPKAVLGMFDPSARPYVPQEILSFAVPMMKFKHMVSYMDESFLITGAWKKIRKRIP